MKENCEEKKEVFHEDNQTEKITNESEQNPEEILSEKINKEKILLFTVVDMKRHTPKIISIGIIAKIFVQLRNGLSIGFQWKIKRKSAWCRGGRGEIMLQISIWTRRLTCLPLFDKDLIKFGGDLVTRVIKCKSDWKKKKKTPVMSSDAAKKKLNEPGPTTSQQNDEFLEQLLKKLRRFSSNWQTDFSVERFSRKELSFRRYWKTNSTYGTKRRTSRAVRKVCPRSLRTYWTLRMVVRFRTGIDPRLIISIGRRRRNLNERMNRWETKSPRAIEGFYSVTVRRWIQMRRLTFT